MCFIVLCRIVDVAACYRSREETCACCLAHHVQYSPVEFLENTCVGNKFLCVSLTTCPIPKAAATKSSIRVSSTLVMRSPINSLLLVCLRGSVSQVCSTRVAISGNHHLCSRHMFLLYYARFILTNGTLRGRHTFRCHA